MPVGAVLQEAEGVIEAGAVLALLNLLLAVPPCPGERTHAVEVPQQVHTVTLVQAGLRETLVYIQLTSLPSPAWRTGAGEALPQPVQTLPAILTALSRHLRHVAHLHSVKQLEHCELQQ